MLDHAAEPGPSPTAMRKRYSLPKRLLLGVTGAFELACARSTLYRIGPLDVQRRNAVSAAIEAECQTAVDERLTGRICEEMVFAIVHMDRRVPWRSDCLVQAVAGQNWLMRRGIASKIVVGVARSGQTEFESHAWLARGDRILLGGNVDRFRPILEGKPQRPSQAADE